MRHLQMRRSGWPSWSYRAAARSVSALPQDIVAAIPFPAKTWLPVKVRPSRQLVFVFTADTAPASCS